MGITYTQTDTTTDCADFSACATGTVGSTATQTELQHNGTAGTSEQMADIPSSSSRLVTFMQTSGGVGETIWESGTYTVKVNVTTAQNNITVTGIWICRIDSSCTSQATVGSDTSLSTDISSGGVFSWGISGSEQSASETDDIYVVIEYTNSHSHSSRSLGITPDQDIDTPIHFHATPSEVTGVADSVSNSVISTGQSISRNLAEVIGT